MANKKIEIPKINVVPILDAVFIFIFFLLNNTQIMDFFQITTSKPVIKDLQQIPPYELKGKFFKTKLTTENIQVTQDVTEKVVNTFSWTPEGMKDLKTFLIQLKMKNPSEKSMVIKSRGDVKYKRIVEVIDTVQSKDVPEYKDGLFRNIAFEEMR